VLAAIRAINRLECVIETLRHALNVLATAAPDWLREIALAEWVERYERRADDYRLPQSVQEREACSEVGGANGHRQLDALYAASSPAWLRELPAVETAIAVYWPS
jgi:transposase